MQNKNMLGLVLSILLLIIGISFTYAAYTYSRQGTSNSKQIVGDIYMHYRESNTLTLENAMPRSSYVANSYFEFTIDGKNTTTNKDIYYDILLSHGDIPQGKTEQNRIQDKFLKFRLVEVVNNEETEIFNNKSYSDLTEKRIHVETIPKNTTTEVVHTYRLYMWIGNDVVIGNTGTPGIDYYITTWSNLFASIKVSSTGDFEEKSMATPASCFTIQVLNEDAKTAGIMSRNYDVSTCGTDVVIPPVINGYTITQIGTAFPGYGLTSVILPNTIKQIGAAAFSQNQLKKINIPESVTNIGAGAFSYNTFNEININCINCEIAAGTFGYEENENLKIYINTENIPVNLFSRGNITSSLPIKELILGNNVRSISDHAFYNSQLTSLVIPNSVTTIGGFAFSNNQITSVNISNSVTTIGQCAFQNNQLLNVEIPNSVTTIGNNAFYHNQLTSLNIPNGVTTIGDSAFSDNQLTSVEIPNSVITIGQYAFERNQLTNVTIGNGIETIGSEAFGKHNYSNENSNPNLASITIDKSCSDIKSINYYPWLSEVSPYTGIGGVTIYGSNNTVCDSF